MGSLIGRKFCKTSFFGREFAARHRRPARFPMCQQQAGGSMQFQDAAMTGNAPAALSTTSGRDHGVSGIMPTLQLVFPSFGRRDLRLNEVMELPPIGRSVSKSIFLLVQRQGTTADNRPYRLLQQLSHLPYSLLQKRFNINRAYGVVGRPRILHNQFLGQRVCSATSACRHAAPGASNRPATRRILKMLQ